MFKVNVKTKEIAVNQTVKQQLKQVARQVKATNTLNLSILLVLKHMHQQTRRL